MNDNTEKLCALKWEVSARFHSSEFQTILDSFIIQALKEVGVSKNDTLRRDYDGVSSAEWLVEKMLGEMLTQGKIKI